MLDKYQDIANIVIVQIFRLFFPDCMENMNNKGIIYYHIKAHIIVITASVKVDILKWHYTCLELNYRTRVSNLVIYNIKLTDVLRE